MLIQFKKLCPDLYPKPWIYEPSYVINCLSVLWHWFLLTYPWIERIKFWRFDLLDLNLLQFTSVSYYWIASAQWVHFWAIQWYVTVLFAYIMGCNWEYLGWKKAAVHVKYWRFWNKCLFFVIPFKNIHILFNYRFVLTVFYISLIYYFINSYLGYIDPGYYLTYGLSPLVALFLKFFHYIKFFWILLI